MKLAKEQITITGMHCSGCSDRVSKVLNELQGVRSADVSLEDEQATIQFDRDQTGIDQMKEAIEKAGYQAQ
jgi:copper ion binding protein